ncbi:MAG: FG-GAP-like repeat-containing protein [Rhodothermales bacterium]
MRIHHTLLLLPFLIAESALAGVAITAVSPPSNSMSPDRSPAISISFSEPLDPATLTPGAFTVFGLWSGVHSGDLSLSENRLNLVFMPDQPFSAGERVTVSVARLIAGDDAQPLAHGYSWHFVVATSPATLSPVETTRISVRQKGEAWIQTYGAYAGDFNEDGFTDLAVPNERSNDFRLFLNDGTGFYRSFDTYSIPSGSRPSVNEGADFDLDGHMDYVVGNSTGATVGLFMGDGNGVLESAGTFAVGIGVRGLAVLDLNGDNYPDVVTASRQQSVVSTLINDGMGSFLPATTFSTPGSGETAAVAADMNEDGIMDVVVGTYVSGDMVVLLGDGEGNVKLHERYPAGGSVWMVVAGDVNGDGHADVVSSNSDDATVSVLLGDGQGGLGLPKTYASGPFTIAVDLGDLDGDGDLDLVSSNYGNSTVDGGDGSWVIFENDGGGHFTYRTTLHSTNAGSCVVLHDRNNDGTLDLTAIDELQDELVLFTNPSVATATEPAAVPSASFALETYPNPMGSRTTLSYAVPEPGRVVIELFDVAGRRLAGIYDDVQSAGSHLLPIDSDALHITPGIYFVVLSTGGRRTSLEIHKAFRRGSKRFIR